MKKLTSLLLAMAFATMTFTGCGGAKPAAETSKTEAAAPKAEEAKTEEAAAPADKAAAPELVLKYGELNPETHPMAEGAKEFARLISEKTNGRIQIDTYFAGQLGDEKTMMQSLQMGAVDMFRGNVVSMGDFGAKPMSVLGLPYVFRDLDHLSKVLRSDIGINLLDEVQKAGTQMVAIGYMEEGPRNMFFTSKKVTKLADLKGLKIRVPETQLMMDTIKALGASPTPISYAELYTSLQTGVVDGAENGITGYATNNFNEVAPIFVKDAHTFGTGLMLVSEKTWNKISDEDKAIFKAAATEAMDYVLEGTKEKEEQYYKDVVAKGAEIIELTDQEAWQEAAKPVLETYGKDYMDLIEQIKAVK
ncbi:MAG: hypothetical protein K0S71_2426 [Clostridia bacterium]|jgi:tripartite ATP-independent transporter DctP family solute receptor|nr:hypothetical protein [Clostridia bacterium]